MTCRLCAGKGIIRIGYQSEPDGYVDFGVCQCPSGQRYRTDTHMDALAAKLGVEPEQVQLVEHLLDAEDFPPAMRAPEVTTVAVDVTEAGRRPKKAKL